MSLIRSPSTFTHQRRWAGDHGEWHAPAVQREDPLRVEAARWQPAELIPPVVSINEAVDIAKKFSTQDSGKFVNGILDRIKGELMRPARGAKE